MNKVQITGRIANELDIRKTQSNKSVLEISVAVNRERKDESGKYPADFIRVICWEQRAEFLNSYAKKGTLIGVSGRIETSNFVNRDGQKVYTTFITAEQVEILNQPKEESPKEDTSMFGGSRDGLADNIVEDKDLPFY